MTSTRIVTAAAVSQHRLHTNPPPPVYEAAYVVIRWRSKEKLPGHCRGRMQRQAVFPLRKGEKQRGKESESWTRFFFLALLLLLLLLMIMTVTAQMKTEQRMQQLTFSTFLGSARSMVFCRDLSSYSVPGPNCIIYQNVGLL